MASSHPRPSTPSKITIKELVSLFDGFLATLGELSVATRRTYSWALRVFVEWFAADGRFLFRARDVERYRRYLAEKRAYEPVTVRAHLNALRRFMSYLVSIGAIDGNPAAEIATPVQRQGPAHSALSVDEVHRLLAAISAAGSTAARDLAIVHTMLGCALSEREVCAANIGDVILNEESTLIRVRGRGRGATVHQLPVPAEAQAALHQYLRWRYDGRMPGAAHAAAPLFLSQGARVSGARMTSRGMRAAVDKWLRASGVKSTGDRRITPFSLRHTAGLLMVRQGLGLEEFMLRMRLDSRSDALMYFRTLQAESGSGPGDHAGP